MSESSRIIKLYNADSLEYAGSIVVTGNTWEYRDVADEYMKQVTLGMPIRGVLAVLINFNMVYDIIED